MAPEPIPIVHMSANTQQLSQVLHFAFHRLRPTFRCSELSTIPNPPIRDHPKDTPLTTLRENRAKCEKRAGGCKGEDDSRHGVDLPGSVHLFGKRDFWQLNKAYLRDSSSCAAHC